MNLQESFTIEGRILTCYDNQVFASHGKYLKILRYHKDNKDVDQISSEEINHQITQNLENKSQNLDQVHVTRINENFCNLFLILSSTIIQVQVRIIIETQEFECVTFKVFRKAIDHKTPLTNLYVINEQIFASEKDDLTHVYNMEQKRATIIKYPIIFACNDASKTSSYDCFLLYSLNKRDSKLEVYQYNYNLLTNQMYRSIDIASKGFFQFGSNDRFYYFNKQFNDLCQLEIDQISMNLIEKKFNLDSDKNQVLKLIQNDIGICVIYKNCLKIFSLENESIINKVDFEPKFSSEYFLMNQHQILEQQDDGPRVCSVNFQAITMEQNYKIESILDPSASYAIFDMRKAQIVNKESILDKLENTSIDNSNIKQKFGSQESVNKNKMKIPKGQINSGNPIIFHSKVKSTNQGKIEPKRELFKPMTQRSSSQNRSSASLNKSTTKGVSLPTYAESAGDINVLETKYCLNVNTKNAITCADVASSGTKQTVGHSDGQVQIMNVKTLNISSQQAFPNMHVNTVQFGAGGYDDIVMALSSKSKALKILNVAKKGVRSELDMSFDQIPRSAKLLQNDALIATTHNNHINFQKQGLCNPTEDDLVRHQSKDNYKLISLIELSDGKSITAIESSNRVKTNYVIAATSDHQLNVLDISNNKIVRSFEDKHLKYINKIKMVDDHQANYNLLYTSANDNQIKLFDLRIKDPIVCSFNRHQSSKTNPSFDVSFNNHQIVTGSEDRAFYIQDARSSKQANLLFRSERKQHNDSITCACFMGRYKSVLTGSVDGQARVFRSEWLHRGKKGRGGSNTDKDSSEKSVVGRMRSASPNRAPVEKTVLRRDNIFDTSPHRDQSMV